MTIELNEDTRRRLIGSIKRYAEERLDEEMGDLKAALLLEFALEEIGPCIYNRAIADAQAHMTERIGDMDGSLYEAEFGYWSK